MENTETVVYDAPLLEVLNYYKDCILPYRYEIYSHNNLKLEFEIATDNLCHLLFGTVNANMVSNYKQYKGQLGYDNIKNGTLTFDNMPTSILKYTHDKKRIYDFFEINTLLDKPKGVFFLNESVDCSGSKNFIRNFNIKNSSDIRADFMLYKNIRNQKIMHLFLRNEKEGGNKIKLVPVSFFSIPISQKEGKHFINKQKGFEVCDSKKVPKK